MKIKEQSSLIGYLKDRGYRLTPQRAIIIQAIEALSGHITAEEIFEVVQQQNPYISMATVYRTLNVLEEAGLIGHRHFLSDTERRFYEPITDVEHYHFTCRECHQVIEFESELMDTIKCNVETKLGVRVMSASVDLEGLCPTCKDKSNQEAA